MVLFFYKYIILYYILCLFFIFFLYFANSVGFGVLIIVKVSGQTPPLAFLGANSVGLEKGFMENFPNIYFSILSIFLGPWGKFCWPRKKVSDFLNNALILLYLSQSCLFFSQIPLVSKKILDFIEDSPNILYIYLQFF